MFNLIVLVNTLQGRTNMLPWTGGTVYVEPVPQEVGGCLQTYLGHNNHFRWRAGVDSRLFQKVIIDGAHKLHNFYRNCKKNLGLT
jgi:hypothetical protein